MIKHLTLLTAILVAAVAFGASPAAAATNTYWSAAGYDAAVGPEEAKVTFLGSTSKLVVGDIFSAHVHFSSPEAAPPDDTKVLWASDAITDAGSTVTTNGVGTIQATFATLHCGFAFDFSSGTLGQVTVYGANDIVLLEAPFASTTGFYGFLSTEAQVKRVVIGGALGSGTRDRIFISKFRVNACPPNRPPTVKVIGVHNGETYEAMFVPLASCSVVDAEDGSSTRAATLGPITGPRAASGLGTQTASCAYTDAGGLTGTEEVTYTIADTIGPTLVTPGAIDFNATSPVGHTISYPAMGAWDYIDGALPVTCSPPSGSFFATGSTTLVTCEARDLEGNTNRATFAVRVLTADEQLANLTRTVEIIELEAGLRGSLLAKLRNGRSDVNPNARCNSLRAFANEVTAQRDRGIRWPVADALLELAANLRTLLGCR